MLLLFYFAFRPTPGRVGRRRLGAIRSGLLVGAFAVLAVEIAAAFQALTTTAIRACWLAGVAVAAFAAWRRWRADHPPAGRSATEHRLPQPAPAPRSDLAPRPGRPDGRSATEHRLPQPAPAPGSDPPGGRPAAGRPGRRPSAVRRLRERLVPVWHSAGRLERVLFAAIAGLLLGELLVALLAEPNNFDSQTYHLPRIEHWVADRDVTAFPTAIHRQVTLAPGAEYLLLHLRLLTGGDTLYNLVQWTAGVGCLLIVSRIVAQFGGGRRAQLLAAFLACGTPMVVSQSTSTQNDLVTAAWAGCVATLVLDGLVRRATAASVLALGTALGLTAVTKNSGLLAAGPLLLLWMSAQLAMAVLAVRRRSAPVAHTVPYRQHGAAPRPRAAMNAITDSPTAVPAGVAAPGGPQPVTGLAAAAAATEAPGTAGPLGTAGPQGDTGTGEPMGAGTAGPAGDTQAMGAASAGTTVPASYTGTARPAGDTQAMGAASAGTTVPASYTGTARPAGDTDPAGAGLAEPMDAGTAPPAGAGTAGRVVRRPRRLLSAAGAGIGVIAVAAVLVGPFIGRTAAEFGNPLGPPRLRDSIPMQRHDPAAVLINALRVGQTALDTPVAPLRRATAAAISRTARLLGVDPQDRATTFGQTTFPVPAWYPDEDRVSFPISGTLGLIGVLVALFRPDRLSPGRRRAVRRYAGCLVAAYVLYSATVKWQPWGNRLILFVLVLAVPLAGLWLDAAFGAARAARAARVPARRDGSPPPDPAVRPPQRQRRHDLPLRRRSPAAVAVLVVLSVAATSAGLTLSYGFPRRLVGSGSVLTTDGWDTRFLRRPEWAAEFRWAATAVEASGARRVGLIQQNDNWEYPWWLLLRGREIVPLQSVVPHRRPADPLSVDAIVCTGRRSVCQGLLPPGWRLEFRGYAGYALPADGVSTPEVRRQPARTTR